MHRILNTKVSDAMTKDVVTVKKDTTLEELKNLWKKYDYNSFPVVENGKLLGVVSKIDFLKIFSFDPDRLVPDLKSIFAQNAGDIMSKDIIQVTPDDMLQDVAKLMLDKRMRSVLVTDESKKELKGIISHKDILKYIETI